MNDFIKSEAGEDAVFVFSIFSIMVILTGWMALINYFEHKSNIETYKLVTACRMKATDPDKVCGQLPKFQD